MDLNNNNQAMQNQNQFLGRAVPVEERRHVRFECRKCHSLVANIHRHEPACLGTKPYRCPACTTGFHKDIRARNHFRLRHPDAPVPAHFLNPEFRHRPARLREQQNAAAAAVGGGMADPPAPQQNPAPPEVVVDAAVEVHPDPPAAVVGADGNVPLPVVDDNVGNDVIVDAGNVILPEQGVNPAVQLGPLLRMNLTANLVQARDVLGSDLNVLAYVVQVLQNPDQFF